MVKFNTYEIVHDPREESTLTDMLSRLESMRNSEANHPFIETQGDMVKFLGNIDQSS